MNNALNERYCYYCEQIIKNSIIHIDMQCKKGGIVVQPIDGVMVLFHTACHKLYSKEQEVIEAALDRAEEIEEEEYRLEECTDDQVEEKRRLTFLIKQLKATDAFQTARDTEFKAKRAIEKETFKASVLKLKAIDERVTQNKLDARNFITKA